MRNDSGYWAAAGVLGGELGETVRAVGLRERELAEEIRLRVGRAPTLLIAGREVPLPCRAVTPRDLDSLLETATRASVHTAMQDIGAGFITVRGGCRIGLCGEAAVSEGKLRGFRHLSSASIRIPREARGCADAVFPRLRALDMPDTLIISPPGAGKTTLLRELIRLYSERGVRVALADERGEVSGIYGGKLGFDLGPCTDVITGLSKARAAAMLLRAMNPQLLAMDEISAAEDIEAALQATGCGVKLLATCHARNTDDLAARPVYRRLMELRVFRAAVIISCGSAGRNYTVKELYPC